MEKYPYRPLDLPRETRILTVQPGKFEDDIICSLSHIDIAAPAKPYEALSYCWSKGVDKDPGHADDFEIQWATYGQQDENGTVGGESGSKLWKDLVDDPMFRNLYIQMGGKMPDGPIICDGITAVVGGELFHALRRLRSEEDGTPLRIWIDALCINQNDISERNKHVKIMDTVYANAVRTRLWLGESTDMDLHAFNTLAAISQTLRELHVKGRTLEDVMEMRRSFVKTGNAKHFEWGLLAELLDRAWFKRTWIIQEIANSKDIVIQLGQFEVPWSLLATTLGVLDHFGLAMTIDQSKGFKAVTIMEGLRRERIDKGLPYTNKPLLTLLEELRDFKATVASDKIYGILTLVREKDEIAVDYEHSEERVFTDFAKKELRSGNLDILTHCVDSSKETTLQGKGGKLPSWAPDWTRPGWTEPLRIRGLKTKAGGDTKPELIIDEAAGILRIKGRMLDKLAAIETKRQIPPPNQPGSLDSDPTDADSMDDITKSGISMQRYGGPIPGVDTAEEAGEAASAEEEQSAPNGSSGDEGKKQPTTTAEQRFAKAMNEAVAHEVAWYTNLIDIAYPNKTATPETIENLWRTFMCNRTYLNQPAEKSHEVGMDILYHMILGQSGGNLEQTAKERTQHQVAQHGLSPEEADAHYKREEEASSVFDGSHVTVGAKEKFLRRKVPQPGDAVAVFYGSDYAFVLRGVERGKWRIIGDCYIHGLVDGEALGDGFEEVEFQIV